MSKSKATTRWVSRYLPAELIGNACALVGANIALFLTGNLLLAAFIGTWSENVGYYGIIIIRDVRAKRRQVRRLPFWPEAKEYVRTTRNIVVEFGAAELLDFFVVRPTYMLLMPQLIDNFSVAIFTASWLSNITFYLPTIASYEARRRYLKE